MTSRLASCRDCGQKTRDRYTIAYELPRRARDGKILSPGREAKAPVCETCQRRNYF